MKIDEQLGVHIHLIYEKPAIAGWEDIRRSFDVHSLYWIQAGKGTFYTDKAHEVTQGMLVYLRPGLKMRMNADQDDPLQIKMILFDCATICYKDGSWHTEAIHNSLEIQFLQQFSPIEEKQVDNMFNQILSNGSSRNKMNELKSKTILTELIYKLIFDDDRQELKDEGTAYHAYVQAKHYIEQHYNQNIKVKVLAEKFTISTSFLRKMFHQFTGESPKQYLNRIRHEQAVRLLVYSEESMKDIAFACGYVDEYHFSKIFKLQEGLPPTRFREQKRVKD
ncbi:helix-turn-helix transcriptional regulator [Radiobacillus sp. PE A8.2]|uniref:AraC family transcriptional regulator n=1 Tax=Radiobacillus sp. PE A8.2 TaxID=3380349 RepID=UPI00388E5AC8